jgi:hypothetical protein
MYTHNPPVIRSRSRPTKGSPPLQRRRDVSHRRRLRQLKRPSTLTLDLAGHSVPGQQELVSSSDANGVPIGSPNRMDFHWQFPPDRRHRR